MPPLIYFVLGFLSTLFLAREALHLYRVRLRSRSRLVPTATASFFRKTRKCRPSDRVMPHWRSKPAITRERVLYLASHGLSARKIEAHLKRTAFDPATHAGKSWIAEFIANNAAEIAHRRRRMRQRPPRMFAIGHTWAMDLSFMVKANGVRFTMLGIIDQGSRRLLCMKHIPHKCALTLIGHLFLTMAKFGMPATVRTDNESMFKSALWRAVFTALGICHRRSRPGCPWQNGFIERLFGTLKPLLRDVRPNTSKALKRTLVEFTWFYNQVRVHQSLNGLTPVEAWNGKSLVDVRSVHALRGGRWVQALDGRMKGFYIRS